MRIVLLSGGSGKRLWPLSNDSRSKQFLKVLYNSKTNMYESMLQRFWSQLSTLNLANKTIISTSKSQSEMIDIQIGNVNKVIEPEKRDTFAAIALSCVYMYDVEKIPLDENIIVAPVDPYVEDEYFHMFYKMSSTLSEGTAELVLMGIKPDHSSEKFGYIVPSYDKKVSLDLIDASPVKEFKEKPNAKVATKLIDEGALWNGGVFGFKLGTLIEYLSNNGYPTDYEKLIKNYSSLPSISFDYEFVEKCKSIAVVTYHGMWKDLGTWNALLTELSSGTIGKVVKTETSSNTKVINELEIPIVVMGVKNSVIAASPDGILISDIDESEGVKSMLTTLSETPMFVERYWGSYKILDFVQYGHIEVITKRVRVNANKKLSYHYHNKRKEIWTIISGEAEVIIDGLHTVVGSGTIIEIEAGKWHSLQAITSVEMIELQRGIIEKDDVYRMEMTKNTVR